MPSDGERSEIGTQELLALENERLTREVNTLKQLVADMHHALTTGQTPPPIPTDLDGVVPTAVQRAPGTSTAVEDPTYPTGLAPIRGVTNETEVRLHAPPPSKGQYGPPPAEAPVFQGPARPVTARCNSDPHLQVGDQHYDPPYESNFRQSGPYNQGFHHEPQVELDRLGKLDESEVLRKVKGLEQAVRIMQGYGDQFNTSFKDLCPFPELQLPDGFIVPKFEPYIGQGDPRVHMKTYCNKMRGVKKDKLLIAYFSESLGGAAAEWFIRQDVTKWLAFDDMAQAFYDQYKYHIEVFPDRSSLDAIKKKPSESFREYALRWREQAARVSPAIPDDDMVHLFIEAQDEAFYGALIAAFGKSFSEVVKMGEMIERGVKAGKIVSQTTLKATTQAVQAGSFGKKNQDDVAMVGSGSQKGSEKRYYQTHSYKAPQMCPPQPYHPPQNPQYSTHPPQYSVHLAQPYAPAPFYPQWRIPAPRPTYPTHQAPHNHFQAPSNLPYRPEGPPLFCPSAYHQKLREEEKNRFTPMGESYSSLFQKLKNLNMLKPIAGNVPPMAKVDHTRQCAYHSDMPGHDTDDCRSLKKAIQALIDNGQIQVEGSDAPDVNQNSLPVHDDVYMVGMVCGENLRAESAMPIVPVGDVSIRASQMLVTVNCGPEIVLGVADRVRDDEMKKTNMSLEKPIHILPGHSSIPKK